MDRDHDNLRATLQWCQAQGYAEPALRLGVALWWFWGAHGHLREGRELLSSLIVGFPIKRGNSRAELYARALSGAGNLAAVQGDHAAARSLALQALTLYQQRGDQRLEALAHDALAVIALASGDLVEARSHLVTSITIQHRLGGIGAVAVAVERFVELAAAQGRWEGAPRLAGGEESLREQAGHALLPIARARLDRATGPARQALEEVAVEAAWRAGYGLPIAESVVAALAITEPPPEPREPALPGAPSAVVGLVLTQREQEVVALIARGFTNRQIAESLVITEGTAANHVAHILIKLGFSSRAQVAVWAAEHGQVVPAPDR